MSTDEEATVIGRMFLERAQLKRSEIALSDEITRLGNSLETCGRVLKNTVKINDPDHEPATYLFPELEVLDDRQKIEGLLQDLKQARSRLRELNTALGKTEG